MIELAICCVTFSAAIGAIAAASAALRGEQQRYEPEVVSVAAPVMSLARRQRAVTVELSIEEAS